MKTSQPKHETTYLEDFLRFWRERAGSASANIFHSARLKLTVFYFAVLLGFCLLLTVGVRVFTSYELRRGDDAQRGAAHQIFERYLSNDSGSSVPAPFGDGDRYFERSQQTQSDVTRQHLNRDFIVVDAVLLAAAAVLSYWYAGRALRPIEAAHEQQKRFTSDASHELRTPLASIRLENEVFLRQKSFTEADARELIASNLEEVDRLEKLATNLLALNQYEHADVSHAPEVTGELVKEAVARVKRSKAARKTQFIQDVVPAKVDVNRDSVIELLTILLDNAAKYGSKDGPVEVTGLMQDDAYVFTVRDHGPGVAEEDLPHIFERMYRGDKARSSRVGGHGIGLNLAQHIATANDAVLAVENVPDGGAAFTITFR